jgi:hypothetical protein
LSADEIETKRFEFLSVLIQSGPMTIGEDMYRIGQKLGFDENLVKAVVDYYHQGRVIEFPVLGPYIRLVHDWYKVLNQRDRDLLRERFLLELEELHKKNQYERMTGEHIFDLMGYHAFADKLTAMIVESLVSDGFVKKINGHVDLTENGVHKCDEIKERNAKIRNETLKRLGLLKS